jgi:ribonucleoside-diphosphate reductase beta chain
MSLLDVRQYYKPFEYPFAFEAYQLQNKVHWLPSEVPLGDDVRDWNSKLSESEKHLLTQIFRFFTQADCDVSESYVTKYLNAFKPPEIRMMLTSFANMESVHMEAYSLLLDTVGMPEVEYKAFLDYEAMKTKHDFLSQFSIDNPKEMAKSMAIISGGIEGIQLFSSFAILMSFPRFNKMKGMGQIITWSVRDESLHVESLSKLFKTFVKENKSIWKDDLKSEIYSAFEEIIKQEDKFIDLCFEMGDINGLAKDDVKQYIRYIGDRRLLGLGMKPIFKVKENPLPWMDYILNGAEFANFFEARVTEYSKGSTKGEWQDVWSDFDKEKTNV